MSASGRRKPPAAGKGRPKGATNKMTRTIKAAIEEAFHTVGGSAYLAKMAIEQPAAFMTLLGKVIPTQLEHSNPDGTMSPTRIVIEAASEPVRINTDEFRSFMEKTSKNAARAAGLFGNIKDNENG